tara:strand:- start:2231 stop:2722 length:492 start_codon:yes stop_codon:yes gene_type:complete
MLIPNVCYKKKEGPDWNEYWSVDLFKGKRVVAFSLPGAFTPICSSKQLPSYEEKYNEILETGVDEVLCISVNDDCVFNAWIQSLGVNKVKYLPDGSGEFTRDMDMLVWKPNQNFGYRSWRYAMVVDNCKVEKMFIEKGKNQTGNDDDPFEETHVDKILEYLKK